MADRASKAVGLIVSGLYGLGFMALERLVFRATYSGGWSYKIPASSLGSTGLGQLRVKI